jgi:hypothetical protein
MTHLKLLKLQSPLAPDLSTMMQPQNLIFWGAGATAELGIRTTIKQGEFIRKLANDEKQKPLRERISEALGPDVPDQWHSALCELITILGDSEKNYSYINDISVDQKEAMRRNWSMNANEEELKTRIVELRLFYDWPALKSVVRICPASATDGFKINDLFNILDMHIPLKFGIRAPAERGEELSGGRSEPRFYDARRLIGARNALLVILTALFYIDYQTCLATKPKALAIYRDFAIRIAHRAQCHGLRLAREGIRLDSPEFYQAEIGFVSLNYDPIGLWMQFIANRQLNRSDAAPHIGSPAEPLHVYHDFGHLIPARGIERHEADRPWYPLNEAAAQRLNEQKYPTGYRVRLTKFLFPHGCLCWRECPNCGKLSAYHGHEWDLQASGLFLPPPLRAFDPLPCPDWITGDEREAREQGKIDARACLHCQTLTYTHHTQAVMQSSFKSPLPSFIEEIHRDLQATAMRADHIIFMGYSLPSDDVEYRAFFAARRQREGRVRCTIVGKCRSHPGWYGPNGLASLGYLKLQVVEAARDIFDKDNIRFYGGGIPEVFLDRRGQPTAEKLEQLVDWESTLSM